MNTNQAKELSIQNYQPSELTYLTPEEQWRQAAEEQWRRHYAAVKQLHLANNVIEQMEARFMEQETKIRELENLALTDPLTGLMNRRGFESFFTQEHSRICRGTSLGGVVIVFDLDNFKGINDIYGHAAGDACLKAVAQYLLSALRIIDGAARLGGDEYAVLLSDTTFEKVMERIYQIKFDLRHMKVEWQGETLEFGASIGIEAVNRKSKYEEVLQTADESLLDEKRQKKAR